MTLCKNRPEGFGPSSTFSSNLPTTCFADVVVVPLATWIYLVILVVVVPLLAILSSKRTRKTTTTATTLSGQTEHKSGLWSSSSGLTWKTRSIVSRTLQVIYYLLIVAMVAMISLELARLAIAELGIGLLPFSYVGVLIACALHALSEPSRSTSSKLGQGKWISRVGVRSVNSLYWLMLLCAMAIKVAAQVKEQDVAGDRVGQQAKYPLSDGITDTATLVGVEFVLFVLEWLAF